MAEAWLEYRLKHPLHRHVAKLDYAEPGTLEWKVSEDLVQALSKSPCEHGLGALSLNFSALLGQRGVAVIEPYPEVWRVVDGSRPPPRDPRFFSLLVDLICSETAPISDRAIASTILRRCVENAGSKRARPLHEPIPQSEPQPKLDDIHRLVDLLPRLIASESNALDVNDKARADDLSREILLILGEYLVQLPSVEGLLTSLADVRPDAGSYFYRPLAGVFLKFNWKTAEDGPVFRFLKYFLRITGPGLLRGTPLEGSPCRLVDEAVDSLAREAQEALRPGVQVGRKGLQDLSWLMEVLVQFDHLRIIGPLEAYLVHGDVPAENKMSSLACISRVVAARAQAQHRYPRSRGGLAAALRRVSDHPSMSGQVAEAARVLADDLVR